MARRRRRGRKRRSTATTQTQGGRKVKVKGHTRSPRGPNAGKPIVKVRGYSRKRPRSQR